MYMSTMVDDERSCELQCGYILKVLIIVLSTIGVVLSVLASNDCQFLYFESDLFSEIAPTFADQTGGWIGIFKYDATNENEETAFEECLIYDDILNLGFPNKTLLASQLCSVMASVLASIAIIVSTVEVVCCKFYGSFIIASVLLLMASLFQCGTFGILFIEQDVCLDSDGCKVGIAAYFSASATFLFFFSCILLCCSPRPRPCMQNYYLTKLDENKQGLSRPN